MLVGVTLIFGTYYTAISAWGHVVRNVQTPGVYPIPKGYLMFVITLGFALTELVEMATAAETLKAVKG